MVNRTTAKDDLIAGITGAMIVLPQGVAFATIAGMPPEYGLYAAMVPAIIAALFGSSWHLVSGPTTAISIAVFAAMSPLADPGSPDPDRDVLPRLARRDDPQLLPLDQHERGLVGVQAVGGAVDDVAEQLPRRDLLGEQAGRDGLDPHDVFEPKGGLAASGGFRLADIERMTAFADYIVPVALRVMNIFEYSPALENAINSHKLIPRDSSQEIEIRAHTIYATALLREEINLRRPPELQVIIPQVDARLWTHYHTTHWPHHLTRTIMY